MIDWMESRVMMISCLLLPLFGFLGSTEGDDGYWDQSQKWIAPLYSDAVSGGVRVDVSVRNLDTLGDVTHTWKISWVLSSAGTRVEALALNDQGEVVTKDVYVYADGETRALDLLTRSLMISRGQHLDSIPMVPILLPLEPLRFARASVRHYDIDKAERYMVNDHVSAVFDLTRMPVMGDVDDLFESSRYDSDSQVWLMDQVAEYPTEKFYSQGEVVRTVPGQKVRHRISLRNGFISEISVDTVSDGGGAASRPVRLMKVDGLGSLELAGEGRVVYAARFRSFQYLMGVQQGSMEFEVDRCELIEEPIDEDIFEISATAADHIYDIESGAIIKP